VIERHQFLRRRPAGGHRPIEYVDEGGFSLPLASNGSDVLAAAQKSEIAVNLC